MAKKKKTKVRARRSTEQVNDAIMAIKRDIATGDTVATACANHKMTQQQYHKFKNRVWPEETVKEVADDSRFLKGDVILDFKKVIDALKAKAQIDDTLSQFSSYGTDEVVRLLELVRDNIIYKR